MSGECLCGAFAKPGERKEIGFWFPEVEKELQELEKEVEAAGKKHCKWGWGADLVERDKDGKLKVKISPPPKFGPLCSSCEVK